MRVDQELSQSSFDSLTKHLLFVFTLIDVSGFVAEKFVPHLETPWIRHIPNSSLSIVIKFNQASVATKLKHVVYTAGLFERDIPLEVEIIEHLLPHTYYCLSPLWSVAERYPIHLLKGRTIGIVSPPAAGPLQRIS
ncbi:hypothetical protein NQ318_011880 [Aromia moschata]|uniref:Uncharacterized protein n=1 Tax=Aromia moschata TaxID=1265417 RepID=A0AAV8XX87_9CUCU|nr:hypothetical protein NQ318_011880 [Aromia moschata]